MNPKKYYRLKSGDIIDLEHDEDLQELEKLTGSSSFTGYMSQNANQVMAQLQALYQAVWKHHIIYTPIKTSFENFVA